MSKARSAASQLSRTSSGTSGEGNFARKIKSSPNVVSCCVD